jgi:hypothetical protein
MKPSARGRYLVLYLAGVAWGPPLLGLALGRPSQDGWLIGAVIPALMVVGLVRRWPWARMVTVGLMTVAAVAATVAVVLAHNWGQRLGMLSAAVAWGSTAVVLALSDDVEAYFNHGEDEHDADTYRRGGSRHHA